MKSEICRIFVFLRKTKIIHKRKKQEKMMENMKITMHGNPLTFSGDTD